MLKLMPCQALFKLNLLQNQLVSFVRADNKTITQFPGDKCFVYSSKMLPF